MKRTKNRESSKEKKEGFFHKIKNMGKNISMDLTDTPTKIQSKKPNRTSVGFNNSDNWINFASKAINIQCLEEINNILHSIEMDPKEASEILIFLYKKYQIKNNDILPLLESQQKRLVQLKYEPKFMKKKKNPNKKIDFLGKDVFVLKLVMAYLDIRKDSPMKLLTVCKQWNQKLSIIVYEKLSNSTFLTPNQKIKVWIKLLNPVKNICLSTIAYFNF